MLTLGIPTTPVMALMVAAMMIHNIQPGPQVMSSNPKLFWGLIVSMWIGNLMLLVLNLPLVGMWVKLLSVPYRIMYPAILLFCCIGAYSINNNVFDVFMTIPFAILGYVFKNVANGIDATVALASDEAYTINLRKDLGNSLEVAASFGRNSADNNVWGAELAYNVSKQIQLAVGVSDEQGQASTSAITARYNF
jgi:TctA family transporter